MLVLGRKRIITMLCMIFVALYVFSFKIANNTENTLSTEKTVETVSTPVTNKVIIVDAGHGTPDVGVSLLHKVKNKSNYSFIKN